MAELWLVLICLAFTFFLPVLSFFFFFHLVITRSLQHVGSNHARCWFTIMCEIMWKPSAVQSFTKISIGMYCFLLGFAIVMHDLYQFYHHPNPIIVMSFLCEYYGLPNVFWVLILLQYYMISANCQDSYCHLDSCFLEWKFAWTWDYIFQSSLLSTLLWNNKIICSLAVWDFD